jgi:hypothetical protein
MKQRGWDKMKLIKKGILLFLLLLFVLSVAPLVLAENHDLDNDKKTDSENRRSKDVNLIERASKVQEKMKDARLKYSEAKDRYDNAKEKYQAKRTELINLKNRAKTCGEDCETRKGLLKKGVKQHLIKTSELIERSIEKLINRLENAPISDEEKINAKETLVKLEKKVTEQREKVELMADDASNEELREAIADLRTTWKEVRQVQKRVISSLTQAKLDKLVDKHDEYLNGMDLRIDSLRNDGVNTAGLERIRDMFEKHLQQFNLDFAKAEEIWNEAETGRDVLGELNNAHKQLKNDVSKTKRLLSEFMKEFREIRPLEGGE